MHLCFNAYLLKKVCVGCRVIKLLKHQDKDPRKLCETTIVKNLRLGSNFPRAALDSRKNAVDIGLIKPKKSSSNIVLKTLHRKCERKKQR